MAKVDVGAWGHSKVVSQAHSSAAIDSGGTLNFYDDSCDASYDDGFDFPPTDHPIRELVSFSIFVSAVLALLVWGGSKLFQAIL
jgi:hypothetical protein